MGEVTEHVEWHVDLVKERVRDVRGQRVHHLILLSHVAEDVEGHVDVDVADQPHVDQAWIRDTLLLAVDTW